jgi:predicted PurR-regulated permease PerM
MSTEIASEDDVRREGAPLSFARRALIAALAAAGVLLGMLFVWYAADLLMLVFAGVLVSILLRGFSQFLRRKTGIGRRPSLAIVTLALVAVTAVGAWLITGRIGSQMGELWRKLPLAVENLLRYVGQFEWARRAIDSLPGLGELLARRSGNVISRLTGVASTTLGAVINILVIAITGLYLALQPDLYSRGIKHLLPFRYRERAGEVMSAIDNALWRWLGGRLGLMLINGGATAVGLWLLGVPLALTLGLLAGLLNFIPNFGPVIAAIPAVLIGLLQSPQQALYVALLYLAVQMIDGYALTPLVERRSVELPPVLTITAQLLLGSAFGLIGVMLATPFTAAATILVKMLYVEDALGDRVMRNDGAESENAMDYKGGA